MTLKRKIRWNYSWIAFAVPFVGMLMVMLFSQYKPFGRYSMLYSDMYHQYYPFFVEFRRALLRGDSLLYSWNVGMGMDYLGLISYYLASPLNLLSIFVPESLLLHFFSMLVPVKLGLASLFFYTFLKKLFGKNDLATALFGGFYGVCAWALGYQWNVMWLDTFALMPLVILGTVSLIRDRKFILYTLTLFLSVYANYYIGFFTCIFVALVFFCCELCTAPGWKRFFADLLWIALFSIIAIGMTAILSLPTLQALQTTQSSVNKFPTTFRLNIASSHTFLGLLGAMRMVAGNMGGSLEPTFKEGLPNLYCGVGTIVLMVMFFMSGEIRLREKICTIFLLLFFNVSFIIRQLDYIWHGFHFTNMIPYRFSFLYSFVMLYAAYRAWLLRRKFDPLIVLSAALFSAALICCSNELISTVDVDLAGITLSIPVYLIYNVTFWVLYTGILIYGNVRSRSRDDSQEEMDRVRKLNKARRKLARAAFLIVMILEVTATLVSFGLYFPGTSVTNYPKGTASAASMIRYMHEREENTLFYRAEMTHSQTLNDGALNGYNGISTFTSSANVHTTEFMKALGYGAKNTYNRYCFEESSPVANLFLGLKYMIERDGRDRSGSMFSEVHHYNKVVLLRNTAYLPLGFLAEPELAELDFSKSDGTFNFQNELFTAATGEQGSVWHTQRSEVRSDGVSVEDIRSGGYVSYSDAVSGSSLSYVFTADADGFACVHLDCPKRNDFYVLVNGDELYRESISLPQMLAVGDVEAGDTIEIKILCDSGESGNMTVRLSILDNDLFFRGYAHLSESILELKEFRSTLVSGSVMCNRDGLLYLSVPQNGCWKVYADGEEVQSLTVGDCMIGIMLQQGTHDIILKYVSPAFALGWKVTAGSALVFALLVQCLYKPDWSEMTNHLKEKFRKRHTGKHS